MGWIAITLLALAVGAALRRFARLDRAGLQLVASALLIAMAGYAWQGRPGLEGSPGRTAAAAPSADGIFAATRRDMLGQFDQASTWLTIADSYQRRGDTLSAAQIVRSGIRAHPDNSDLWVGLGHALTVHAGGTLTPAAELAFRRAAALSPEASGPPFYYALALAQAGEIDRAERIWSRLLATAPADAAWRPHVERQLQLVAAARALSAMERAPPPAQ